MAFRNGLSDIQEMESRERTLSSGAVSQIARHVE